MGVLKDLQLQGLNVGRGISSVQNEDKVKKKASYYILTAVSVSSSRAHCTGECQNQFSRKRQSRPKRTPFQH